MKDEAQKQKELKEKLSKLSNEQLLLLAVGYLLDASEVGSELDEEINRRLDGLDS